MDDIQEGSVIFLYNSETQALLGPFTTSEHGTVLEKGAWAEDIDHNSASENVKVEWEDLHLLQGATKELPFLKTPKNCMLSETQTQRTLDLLKQAPLFEHKNIE